MMRRRLAKVIAWAKTDKVRRNFQLAAVAFGATCLKNLLTEQNGRLEALEERGLVPLDDMVTIRDLSRIDRRVWVLEGGTGPDPAAAFAEAGDGQGEELGAGELEEEAAAEQLAQDRPADE